MVSAHRVPASELIKALSQYLKEHVKEVSPPEWAGFVKTGVHKERAPTDPDWWYVRAASIMRKLYIHGPLGIETLRTVYGGRKKKRKAMEHHYKASGAVIRKILQQLEIAGYVEKVDGEGRRLTPKGVSLVDKIAHRLLMGLAKQRPELRKYSPIPLKRKG